MKKHLILASLMIFSLFLQAQKRDVFLSFFTNYERVLSTVDAQTIDKSYGIAPFEINTLINDRFIVGVGLQSYSYIIKPNTLLKPIPKADFKLFELNKSGEYLSTRFVPKVQFTYLLGRDTFVNYFVGTSLGVLKNLVTPFTSKSVQNFIIDDMSIDAVYRGEFSNTPISLVLDIKSGIWAFGVSSSPIYIKIESFFRVMYIGKITHYNERIVTSNFPDQLIIENTYRLPVQKMAGLGITVGYRIKSNSN